MTTHKNAMDDIIIRYGQPQRTYAEKSKAIFFKVVKEHITREQAEEEFKPKEISLPEFLRLKKEELSPEELKIQTVLGAIYSINNGQHPVYRSFPKREVPLTIDLTKLYPDKGAQGIYAPQKNEIVFSKIKELGFVRLIEVLAHEMKHAQQYMKDEENFNNYQKHQLGFLEEAQANACADRVLSVLCPDHPRAVDFKNSLLLFTIFGHKEKEGKADNDPYSDYNLKNAEELRTIDYLHKFLVDKKFRSWYAHYKDSYDKNFPILKTDTPLTQIPPEFDILYPERILETLELNVSKRARLPHTRAKQAMLNGDKRALTILLKSKDKNGNFLISDESLFGVGVDALYIAEEKETPELLETILKSGRFSAQDITELLGLTFHLSSGEKLTDKLLASKTKLLDVLLKYRAPNGRKVITSAKIDETIENAKVGANLDNNDEYKKLIKHLEEHINSTKVNMKKRLKKHQLSSPKKQCKSDTPEI